MGLPTGREAQGAKLALMVLVPGCSTLFGAKLVVLC